jgi:hypothetical protein
MAFMGSCFTGAIAISHAFFIFSVSISSGVGTFRTAVLDSCERSLRVMLAVKPGGSCMRGSLGLFDGAELRSRTHCGVGGVCETIVLGWRDGVWRGYGKCGRAGCRGGDLSWC